MKKTYLVIGILLLILLTIAFILVINSNRPTQLTPTTPPPPIILSPIPSAPLNPQFNFPQEGPPEFPKELTLYSIATPPQPIPLTIGGQLNFTSPPHTTSLNSITTHRWQEPQIGALVIKESPVYLFYSSFQNTPPPPNNPIFSDATITQFLQTIDLHQTTYPLIKIAQEYFKGTEYSELPTTRQSANLSRFTYAYSLSNVPFFTSSKPLFSVQATVTAENTLKEISVFPPPTLKIIGPQTLIPVAQSSIELANNRGFLVSATTTNPTEATVNPNFNKVTIKSVSLIYIQDLQNQLVRPVYQFIGTAPHLERPSIKFDIVYLVNAT